MPAQDHSPFITRRARPRGFTLAEAALVVAVMGLLAAIVVGRGAPLLQRGGAGNAAALVALDLEQAVSLAARQRRPVRVAFDSATLAYTLSDRMTGDLLVRRVVGGRDAGYHVTSARFAPNAVDVFPSGRTSAALEVTLRAGDVERRVTMSSGGFVRVAR